MGLYRMLHGVSGCTFFVLPMLGKHPEEYPRFRDCFITDEEHPEHDDHIHVYTRVGGNNRGQGYGEEELYTHPLFVTTFDDSFDSTYATYVFKIPEEWQADFEKFKEKKLYEFSEAYKQRIIETFPKIKEQLTKILYPEQEISHGNDEGTHQEGTTQSGRR